MRDQTLNSFNDGLNTDLNALVTPNTVMTDCLNGTLITYNGNEYVLQNDMGNGKVETAYLPTGYVPVGMKEHGGIIYVASYNPLTKQSLLGSFPSPERNIESLDNTSRNIDFFLPTNLTDTSAKVFKDGITIKPGNKFCIGLPEFAGSLNSITPNFTANGELYKGQNSRYNITLNVINSNGILVDVTDTCKSINGYFFTTTAYSNELSVVKHYTDNLTSYSSKLSGIPFIKVVSNRVNNWNVGIITDKDSKEIGEDDSSTTNVNLHFNIEYKYNGPIVGFNGGTSGLTGFKMSYSNYTLNASGIKSNIVNSSINITSNLSVSNTLDQNGLYTINLEASHTFTNYRLDSFIEILLTPIYSYDSENKTSPDLVYNAIINVNKIKSDYNEINTWRYFIDDKYLTLTWGMESYPSDDKYVPHNIMFEFYDLLNVDTPIYTLGNGPGGTSALDQSNYNGMFTHLIPIEENISDGLLAGKVYLVKIKWTDKTDKFSWRYVITTSIDNTYYWNVLDFVDITNHTARQALIYPGFNVTEEIEYESEELLNLDLVSTNVKEEVFHIKDETTHKFDILTIMDNPAILPFTGELSNFKWGIKNLEKDIKYDEETPLPNEVTCVVTAEDSNKSLKFTYDTSFSYKFASGSSLKVDEVFKTYSVREFSINDLDLDFPNINIYLESKDHGALHEPDWWIQTIIYTGTKNSSREYAVVDELFWSKRSGSDEELKFGSMLDDFMLKEVGQVVSRPLVCGITYNTNEDKKIRVYNYLIYNGEKYIFAYTKGNTSSSLGSANKYNRNRFAFENASKAQPYDPNRGYLKDVAICLGSESINSMYPAILDPEKSKKIEPMTQTVDVNISAEYTITLKYEGSNYNSAVLTAINTIKGTSTNAVYTKILKCLQFLVPENGSSEENSSFTVKDSYTISNEPLSVQISNDITGNEELYYTVKNIAAKGIKQLICYKKAGQLTYSLPIEELNPNIAYKIDPTSGKATEYDDVVIGTLNGSTSLQNRHVFLLSKNKCTDVRDQEHHHKEGTKWLSYNSIETAGL